MLQTRARNMNSSLFRSHVPSSVVCNQITFRFERWNSFFQSHSPFAFEFSHVSTKIPGVATLCSFLSFRVKSVKSGIKIPLWMFWGKCVFLCYSVHDPVVVGNLMNEIKRELEKWESFNVCSLLSCSLSSLSLFHKKKSEQQTLVAENHLNTLSRWNVSWMHKKWLAVLRVA